MQQDSSPTETPKEPAANSESADLMPHWQALGFGFYLIVLNLLLLYVLIKIWPGTIPIPTDGQQTISVFGLDFPMPLETRYLLIVALTGALGSYIHLATSFTDYAGNRKLVQSWGWWYALRPFIGMALAVIVYFVVRGGLITGMSGAENLSLFGVAAIAGLAGMFSKQATDKLEEVFENFFKTDQNSKRADPLTESSSGESKAEDPPSR